MIIGELTETYPPMQDGVGRVCWAYCKALERAGHTAYYIAPDDPEQSRIEGLNTLLYGGLQIPRQNYRLGTPDLSRAFWKRVREIPFDILHIHSPFLSFRIARQLQRINPEIPIVATFHSKYYDDAYKVTHSNTIARQVVNHIIRIYDQCDEVWTMNPETANVLRSYGYRGEIVISPNGTDLFEIDRERAAETRRRLGIPEEKKVLLFVGQIDRKKNIHSVLQACALLKKEGLDFELLLAGEGPDRGSLEKLQDELDLGDRVRFLGFIRNGEELRCLYTLADLFVFPSLYDNAPMVVREAAVCGTASVLVRGSCSAEGITDGVNGFLCENRVEDIARAIREGLPSARETGARARETIPKPWDEIIADVLERYGAMIERKKAEAFAAGGRNVFMREKPNRKSGRENG